MSKIFALIVAVGFALFCNAGDLVEKSWFPTVDGADVKGEYIDLNKSNNEKLFIRYSALTDSGVELEKTSNNVVIWRTHVQPIKPNISHSKFSHEVSTIIFHDEVTVHDAVGFSLGKESGIPYANSKGAKITTEVHSLTTGALISRDVRDLPPRP